MFPILHRSIIPRGIINICAYDVVGGKPVENSRVFAEIEPGQPDGFKVDSQGNLFISSAVSIQIYTSNGTRLGKIWVPEICTNLAFGGDSGQRLFITAGQSLYGIDLQGARRKQLPSNTTRWNKGPEFLIERNGKIITYGENT